MRSIETGRPLIRATNTGYTSFIDHKGKIVQILPSIEPNYLVGKVQGMNGKTPYSIFGNNLILFICFLIFIMGLRRYKF
jgi:apolipoprotein N-acyltransferase